jgi:hypothetical protein
MAYAAPFTPNPSLQPEIQQQQQQQQVGGCAAGDEDTAPFTPCPSPPQQVAERHPSGFLNEIPRQFLLQKTTEEAAGPE